MKTGVPQGSILGLLFLFYINDISEILASSPKPFANHSSLFGVAEGCNLSAMNLNNDLDKISNCPFQWKMNVNPDPCKQAQEVLSSRKLHKLAHLLP